MKPFRLFPPVLAILLAACAATSPRHEPAPAPVPSSVPATPAAPEGPLPNDNLNAVVWTQTTVEHDLVYREVFRHAQEQLLRALKDRRWDALPHGERDNDVRRLKPAVIVDIDETMLDNSPYQARLVRDGTSYDEFSWSQWCKERRARAMPGALEFARFADAHGVTVFYLSNRAQDLDAATLDNLRGEGFPIAAGEPVFLGLGTFVEGCEQVGSEKGCRRRLVARKHRVLLQVGDQIGDFVDVEANTPAGRRAAVAPYLDWVGERWFALPNPTYGSWEPALFNNAWSRPAEQRRAAKLNELRY